MFMNLTPLQVKAVTRGMPIFVAMIAILHFPNVIEKIIAGLLASLSLGFIFLKLEAKLQLEINQALLRSPADYLLMSGEVVIKSRKETLEIDLKGMTLNEIIRLLLNIKRA